MRDEEVGKDHFHSSEEHLALPALLVEKYTKAFPPCKYTKPIAAALHKAGLK
jgi:hypothetical protein